MTRYSTRWIFSSVLCLWSGLVWASEISHPQLIERFKGERPTAWGECLRGVETCVEGPGKIVALTFDACGGRKSGDYDKALIAFLIENEIPATLFINARWIDAHREDFLKLADNALFEIANHGTNHRPLSVAGRSAYGIRGTADVDEIVGEVENNARKIEALTGQKPRWFRSGTANYDDVAVRVVEALGYRIAGYGVNGDCGGTASAKQVKRALLSVRSGDIVLCHMNRPKSGTREGVIQAIPLLRERGFRFVRLSEAIDGDGH